MPKNMSKDIKTEIPGKDDNDSLSAGNQIKNEKSGVAAGGCGSETGAQDESPCKKEEIYMTDEDAHDLADSFIRLNDAIATYRAEQEEEKLRQQAGDKQWNH